VFECPALQGIRDTYNGLVGDYAAMIEFMWQHNTYAIMQFSTEGRDAYSESGPQNPGTRSALGDWK